MAGPAMSTNKNKTTVSAIRVRGEIVRRRKYSHVPSARIGVVTSTVMRIGSTALDAA
ncbi:MAG: hypothetical protein N2379_11030 [Verrucomicrobiae bacterium]|nr:hypothetical protein [Verrucomicrobiae bacterium]